MVGFELITSSVNKNYDITSKNHHNHQRIVLCYTIARKGHIIAAWHLKGIIAYLDLEEEHMEIREPEWIIHQEAFNNITF